MDTEQRRNPWAEEAPRQTLLDRFSDGMRWAHSPDGMRAIGWGIFAASASGNAYFWASVFAGMPAHSALWSVLIGKDIFALSIGLLSGVGVSIVSTWFQCAPIINGSAKSLYSELVAGAVRPQVAHLPSKPVDQGIASDYDGSIGRFRSTQKKGRFIATAVEFTAGLIFIGSIFGSGWIGLIKLLGFAVSVFGAEMGAGMAVHADNAALSPEGREVMITLEKKAIKNARRGI